MEDKITMLKGMHELVRHMNDEKYYMDWINIVPDCPQEEDFWFIAHDEELFAAVLRLFVAIIRKATDENKEAVLVIGKKVYGV